MFGLYEKQNNTTYKQMGGVRFRRFFHFDDNGHFGQWKITDETLTPNFEIRSYIDPPFPPTKWTVFNHHDDMSIPDNDIKIVTGAEATEYKPCQRVTINFEGTPPMKSIKTALGEPKTTAYFIISN